MHTQTCGRTAGGARSSSSPGPSQPGPSAPGCGGFCSRRSGSRLHSPLRRAPAGRLPDSDPGLGFRKRKKKGVSWTRQLLWVQRQRLTLWLNGHCRSCKLSRPQTRTHKRRRVVFTYPCGLKPQWDDIVGFDPTTASHRDVFRSKPSPPQLCSAHTLK